MKNLIYIIVLSLLLISCDETKKVIDTAGQVQLSGSYDVITLEGVNLTENAPTINFSALEKSVNGTTGCNRYFGQYILDLYVLSISEIASTELACSEPIMKTEFAFLSALNNTGSYTLEKGVLTLYSKIDRSVLLTAKKEKITGN